MDQTFVYRKFFVRGSSQKTYAHGAVDQTSKYDDVWRLAPRRELMNSRKSSDVRVGETLRFLYGIREQVYTGLVTSTTATNITCKLLCGSDRGSSREFDRFEVTDCFELFGSPLIKDLTNNVKAAVWEDARTSRTRDFPESQRELNRDFFVPEGEKYKRKWHLMKILGEEGVQLLCDRTNERANRVLSKSSSNV